MYSLKLQKQIDLNLENVLDLIVRNLTRSPQNLKAGRNLLKL